MVSSCCVCFSQPNWTELSSRLPFIREKGLHLKCAISGCLVHLTSLFHATEARKHYCLVSELIVNVNYYSKAFFQSSRSTTYLFFDIRRDTLYWARKICRLIHAEKVGLNISHASYCIGHKCKISPLLVPCISLVYTFHVASTRSLAGLRLKLHSLVKCTLMLWQQIDCFWISHKPSWSFWIFLIRWFRSMKYRWHFELQVIMSERGMAAVDVTSWIFYHGFACLTRLETLKSSLFSERQRCALCLCMLVLTTRLHVSFDSANNSMIWWSIKLDSVLVHFHTSCRLPATLILAA
jgi:hypothetical protein